MTGFESVAVVAVGVVLGVFVTVLVQWAGAVRKLSRDLAHANRQIAEVAELLKPTAHRIDRASAALERSEPDLRRMQEALHRFSVGSAQFSDTFARVSTLAGIALPVAAAAVERWSEETDETPAQPTNSGRHEPTEEGTTQQ